MSAFPIFFGLVILALALPSGSDIRSIANAIRELAKAIRETKGGGE